MLIAKANIFQHTLSYFDDGKHVAEYDEGSCTFNFTDGKEYSFSLWTPGSVKDTVFPKGSANIASIHDRHREKVNDKQLANYIVIREGMATCYREGNDEVVAHSETLLGNKTEWEIICNGNRYSVFKHNAWLPLYGRVDVHQRSRCIAVIRWGFASMSADFQVSLSLTERIFVSHLTQTWWI